MEYHGSSSNVPPIRIVIADGETNEDVIIKVSDEGGGIRRSNMPRIWSYLYTTADQRVVEDLLNTSESAADFATSSPLAGLGYGLPISRLYARLFGGDLILMSMEGYGTDSFFYLPRLNTSNGASTTSSSTSGGSHSHSSTNKPVPPPSIGKITGTSTSTTTSTSSTTSTGGTHTGTSSIGGGGHSMDV